MKTKSIVLITIGSLLIASLAVAGFLIGLNYYSVLGAKRVLSALLLTIASFAFWYLVHNLLHEVFHAVFCKLSGGKVVGIAFWGMEFSFIKGDKRFKFAPRSGYAGWTEFVCKKPEKAYMTLYISTLGGLVGTFLTMVVIAVLCALVNNRFSIYFVLMGFVPTFYMFYLNYMCDLSGSDGRLLFLGKYGYGEFGNSAIRLETECYLFKGKSLKDAQPVNMLEAFAEAKKADFYDYLLALQMGDMALAKEVLTELENDTEYADNRVIDPFIERFFIACIEKNDKEIKLYSDDVKYVFDKTTLNALRVHCAYRYYAGEYEWGDLLKNSYFKACDKIPVKGLAKTYKEIGERLLLKPLSTR